MPATAPNRRRAGALALALLFAVSAVRADVHADLADVLATMTGALADDNPAAFLAAIDKKSPDYAKLSADFGPKDAMGTFFWLCRGLYMTRVSDGFQLPLERENVFVDFYQKSPASTNPSK